MVSNRFSVLSQDRILTLEAGANQILLHQCVNTARPILCDIIKDRFNWRFAQGNLLQALAQR